VWPHDNGLIAAGLARYGFVDAARRVLTGLIEASRGFERSRLPELFGGFERREGDVPVPYPAANAPQAWAAGTVVLGLRTLLGIEPRGDTLASTPLAVGPAVGFAGVRYRGRSVSVGDQLA